MKTGASANCGMVVRYEAAVVYGLHVVSVVAGLGCASVIFGAAIIDNSISPDIH